MKGNMYDIGNRPSHKNVDNFQLKICCGFCVSFGPFLSAGIVFSVWPVNRHLKLYFYGSFAGELFCEWHTILDDIQQVYLYSK